MPWDEDEPPARVSILAKDELWDLDGSFEAVLASTELLQVDILPTAAREGHNMTVASPGGPPAESKRVRDLDHAGKRSTTQSRYGTIFK